MIDLNTDGEVRILTMDDGENRYSPANLDALDACLSEVEATDGPHALVTVGSGKFFSNGLDLDWLGQHLDEVDDYLGRVHALFARYLSLRCVTVAAINGHAFAGGAMLSLCHDHRIMRTDRGYWCLPEVDLAMTFTAGMNALIPAMLPARTAHEAMVTGRRYTAEDALAGGIIDATAPEADVLERAVDHARTLAAKAGPSVAGIRKDLYAPVIAALAGPR